MHAQRVIGKNLAYGGRRGGHIVLPSWLIPAGIVVEYDDSTFLSLAFFFGWCCFRSRLSARREIGGSYVRLCMGWVRGWHLTLFLCACEALCMVE